MAKESVDIAMIPKVTLSSVVALRRHSAAIASSGNNEKKVIVPHYLRASTGSCHDFCKYGRKGVQEAREKLSMIKKSGRNSLWRSSEDSIGGIITIVAKQKASIDSKPTKMSTVKPVDSVLQISDTNKVELSTKSSGIQRQIGNKILVNTSKASVVRVKPSFLPKSHISSILEKRRGRISSSFVVETPSKPTSKRMGTSLIATSERVKTHPKSTSQMVKTSSKPMSVMKKTSSKVSSFEDKEMELSDKHVTSLNPDFITMKALSPMTSSQGFGGQGNSKIKMKKREASPKSSCRRVASVSARKYKGLKIVPHLMNQPKPTKVEHEEHNNEAQEKTLYVIKMERAHQTLQSDQNECQDIELPLSNSLSSPKFSSSSISQSSFQENQEKSEYATSEFEEEDSSGNYEIEYKANVDTLEVEENGKPQKDVIVCSEDKEIERMENVDTLEVVENGKPQKDVIVCSEDKDCQKLRGNLAETQIEKGSLKSLKFQRGKMLGDNTTDVKACTIIGAEKVVLRHQVVQVKKAGQGLYNNVIEETASKLVGTQKSKVKALVSAFEAVISLEEKRTFANFVN